MPRKSSEGDYIKRCSAVDKAAAKAKPSEASKLVLLLLLLPQFVAQTIRIKYQMKNNKQNVISDPAKVLIKRLLTSLRGIPCVWGVID